MGVGFVAWAAAVAIGCHVPDPPELPEESWLSTPGVRERSGRLIVRPLSEREWIARGLAPFEARARCAAARARLDPYREGSIAAVDIHVVTPPGGMSDQTLAKNLLLTGEYAYAAPDWILYPTQCADSNDPRRYRQWQLDAIQAVCAWQLHTGKDVIIGFVDTGIDLAHEDLAESLVPGYNSVNKLRQDQGGAVDDVNGHGTGTAAAAAVGNNGIGIAGVGWKLKAMPVRASNSQSGGAFLSDIFDGAIWAASNGAKAINVSFAGVDSAGVDDIGEWIRGRGSILVWAADNDNQDYDFELPHVLVVGGVDENDQKTPESSYGRAIDLVAPAKSVHVTARGNSYATKSGNSYAGPLVSGAMAMLWSASPSLGPVTAQSILFDNADDLGNSDIYGHGRLNLHRALSTVVVAGDPGEGGITIGDDPVDIEPDLLVPGLQANYFTLQTPTQLPDFSQLDPHRLGKITQVNYPSGNGSFAGSGLSDNVGAVFQGYLFISDFAAYTLGVESNEGSRVTLGNLVVIDNDGIHSMREVQQRILLAPGYHKLKIEFFEATGGAGLIFRIEGPGLPRQPVPASSLGFLPSPADFNADGNVDALDSLQFMTYYGSGDLRADFVSDGVLNVFDFLEFQNVAAARYGY